MKDKINTRKCFIVTDIKEAKAFKEDGSTDTITHVELKEIHFMNLQVDDKFVLYEDTGEMVIDKDKDTGKEYTTSIAQDKPFVADHSGTFSVRCERYDLPTAEVKYLRRTDDN